MNASAPEMLSITDLATYLGKSRQSLYQWRARGVFPFRTHGKGRGLRVSRREVDAYVARHGAVPGRPPLFEEDASMAGHDALSYAPPAYGQPPQEAPSGYAPPARQEPMLSVRSPSERASMSGALELALADGTNLSDAAEFLARVKRGDDVQVVLGSDGCVLRVQ